eukprot:1207129-Pyramimonas_sp.AAC.1
MSPPSVLPNDRRRCLRGRRRRPPVLPPHVPALHPKGGLYRGWQHVEGSRSAPPSRWSQAPPPRSKQHGHAPPMLSFPPRA